MMTIHTDAHTPAVARSRRTEQTANGLATYSSPDFRTYAPVETVHGGRRVRIQLCEEFEAGRWEGFYSYVRVK